MYVTFRDTVLARLEADASFTGGFDEGIVRSFRKRMQMVRAADDERVFYALRSLHYEKLKGNRGHQRSMRLNAQWRLIVEIEVRTDGKLIAIIAIEDYH